MSQGLLYIAFGKEYDKLAAHTVSFSRRFTDLPICVLSNVQSKNLKWKQIKDVTFKNFKNKQNDNRVFKTQMNRHTPFDETLYLDCDSVIQRPGIEKVFDLLKDSDVVLNRLLRWNKGQKLLKIYKTAMRRTGVKLPLNVYNGAFVCWQTGLDVNKFFNTWYRLWSELRQGREMPALACAVTRCSVLRVKSLPRGFFSPEKFKADSVVQHNYTATKGSPHFFARYGLPVIKFNRCFDSDPNDWLWEYFE